ncbi:MAG: hypothetical protein Q7S57_06225 [bacterium]|nr:hypothetical protein [bacterium]
MKTLKLLLFFVFLLPLIAQAVGGCSNGKCLNPNPVVSPTSKSSDKPADAPSLPKLPAMNSEDKKPTPNTEACGFVSKGMQDGGDDDKMYGQPNVASFMDEEPLSYYRPIPNPVPIDFYDISARPDNILYSASDVHGLPTYYYESATNFFYRTQGVDMWNKGLGGIRTKSTWDKSQLYPDIQTRLNEASEYYKGLSNEEIVRKAVGKRSVTIVLPTIAQNKDTSKVSYIPDNGSSQEIRPIVVNEGSVISSVKTLQDGQTPDTKVNDDCSLTELSKDEAKKLQNPQPPNGSGSPQGQGGGGGGGGEDGLSKIMSALQQALSAAKGGQNNNANTQPQTQPQASAQPTPAFVPMANKVDVIGQAMNAGIPTSFLESIFQSITKLLENISLYGLSSDKTARTVIVQ